MINTDIRLDLHEALTIGAVLDAEVSSLARTIADASAAGVSTPSLVNRYEELKALLTKLGW